MRDQNISGLVTAMEDTYVFVSAADELKKSEALQITVEQILKQTIECGFFIQDYARTSFGGLCSQSSIARWSSLRNAVRAVTQSVSGIDVLIAKFCFEFSRLRSNFDSGVSVDTGLVLSRAAKTIDMISA